MRCREARPRSRPLHGRPRTPRLSAVDAALVLVQAGQAVQRVRERGGRNSGRLRTLPRPVERVEHRDACPFGDNGEVLLPLGGGSGMDRTLAGGEVEATTAT